MKFFVFDAGNHFVAVKAKSIKEARGHMAGGYCNAASMKLAFKNDSFNERMNNLSKTVIVI